MKSTEMFKLAWEYAAAGAEKYGGKKSEYFKSALDYVRGWYKEGKTKEEIRGEIYNDMVFVEESVLPILTYEAYFKRGKKLDKYTEAGNYESFWFRNQGQGNASRDDIDMGWYLYFEDSERYTREDFLKDYTVMDIVSDKVGQSVRYIEHLNRIVYANLYDKLIIEGVELKAPEPDEDELAAMHEWEEERIMKKWAGVDVPF